MLPHTHTPHQGIPKGTIAGHVFPGSVILLLGLHWAAGIGRCIAVGAPYSRSWHALPWQRGVGARPWEPWLKVFFTFFMGILMELYYKDPWKYGLDWWWRPLISEDGAHFTFVDSWHHACMHLAFLACGLLELGGFYLAAKGYASPLQCSLELAMLALAFALETIMGVLHALGGEGLPAEIHKMQTLFFTVAAAAAISEASHGGHARIAPFVRVTATVAAGVWMCFNALVYAWQSNGNSAWARDPMAAHVLVVYAVVIVYVSIVLVGVFIGASSVIARYCSGDRLLIHPGKSPLRAVQPDLEVASIDGDLPTPPPSPSPA